ncbi:MAG: FadR/GntR family transcriptional regulator [Thermodesulfobacteriota bacterium]
MEIAAIKKRSAADEVFSILHGRIMAGELKPGDRLPPQDELARQLKVSRNTLREAIHKLTVMGLLAAKPGVGTVIQLSNPARYLGALGDHLLLDSATVREFVEARLFVEKATIRLAVLRATAQDLRELEAIVAAQEKAFRAGQVESFSRLDAEFHMRLARMSNNHVLVKFLETLWDLLQRFILEVARLPSAIENAVGFHRRMIRYIAKHDLAAAEAALVSHLWDVVRNIEQNLGTDLHVTQLFELERKAGAASPPATPRKRKA